MPSESNVTIQDMIATLKSPAILGQHFFIPNPNESPNSPALVPEWDFTSSSQDANAFFIGEKTGDLPAPTGYSDVDWLSLSNVQGGLADYIYRVDTRSGQPPSSVSSLQVVKVFRA